MCVPAQILPYAAAGAAAVGGLAAAVAAAFMHSRGAARIAAAAQELVDVRRRAALEAAKAERYGGDKLVKALLP